MKKLMPYKSVQSLSHIKNLTGTMVEESVNGVNID